MRKDNMDPLENYVLKNRDAFDSEKISKDLFSVIQREYRIKQIRTVYIKKIRSIAAVLAVISVLGFSLAWYQNHQINSLREQIITANNPEFYEAEAYFQNQIQAQLVLLKSEDNIKLVLEEFNTIDREIEILKQEILSAPNSLDDKLVGALINAYRTKLSILEKVLNSNVNGNQKMKSNETII